MGSLHAHMQDRYYVDLLIYVGSLLPEQAAAVPAAATAAVSLHTHLSRLCAVSVVGWKREEILFVGDFNEQ